MFFFATLFFRGLKGVVEGPLGTHGGPLIFFSEFSRIFTFSTPRGGGGVMRSYTRKVGNILTEGGKLNFHAPIGALVSYA